MGGATVGDDGSRGRGGSSEELLEKMRLDVSEGAVLALGAIGIDGATLSEASFGIFLEVIEKTVVFKVIKINLATINQDGFRKRTSCSSSSRRSIRGFFFGIVVATRHFWFFRDLFI